MANVSRLWRHMRESFMEVYMKQRNGIKVVLGELVKGVLAFLCSGFGIMEAYPLLPAYFAVNCVDGQASASLVLGAVLGMFYFMTMESILKYIFIVLTIGLGIRLYIWSNHYCSSVVAAVFAGGATTAMHYAGNAFFIHHNEVLLQGVFEGVMVSGITILLHYLYRLPEQMDYFKNLNYASHTKTMTHRKAHEIQKMESFAYAVNGLSDAFLMMSQPKEKLVTEEVSILEQEVTGKLCANCDGCAICWNENRMRRQGGIRALLHAVVNHTSKDELLQEPYLNDCRRYERMVEEAIQAFGRLELNYAWYNRLRENRYVIAQQLDAMAGLMEEWAKARINVDKQHKKLMTQIVYEVHEKGLLVEDLHVYEDNKRLCVEAEVCSKWDGGIPIKHYVAAVEKAMKKPMRLGKEHKSILSNEPVFLSLYEDTRFYGLQGIATEKKNGSMLSGDSYAFFAMDDGNYHICLSDGMGSGNRASQESEMVVDLLQKFIEAGFRKETAIKLMNSAMVLQGEENTYSTLDYAMVDLYTGDLELIKIGGAATFIKRGEDVECIDIETLPTGADVRMEVESTKKQLKSGDFLVMVTDGVIEYLNVRNPKDALSDIIASIQTDNAGVLADTILQKVLYRTGGYAMDDMTILVTGIWEK